MNADMIAPISVHLPLYGTVTGKSVGEGLECFLGIPFASVKKRWTKPEPAKPFPGGHHDGTRYGPICPQQQTPVSITQLAAPEHPPNPDVVEDEFACLNLNIIRPSQSQGKLPVMVWIHGGAFSVGSNSETVYNGVDLVVQSQKCGQPIIHVAINYRLGIFGFMASDVLLEETGSESVGNYGLWDQKAALEFVHSTIEEFGGDPLRITLYGESAGAVSVHSHLLAGGNFFSQAICQSGVVSTLGPLPLASAFHQGLYEEYKTKLGAGGVVELRNVPASEIVKITNELYPAHPAAMFLVDDSDLEGGFFPRGTLWNTIPDSGKAVILGYCSNEGIIMAQALTTAAVARTEKLQQCLVKSELAPTELLSALGVAERSQLQNLMPLLIEFQGDLAFKGPIEAVKANTSPESLFAYRFERENKWQSSPFNGMAHHTIDLLYLAGVPFRQHTDEPSIDQQISEQMMTCWIKFGNGQQPWAPYSQQKAELVIGRDGTFRTVNGVDAVSKSTADVQSKLHERWTDVVQLVATLSNGVVR